MPIVTEINLGLTPEQVGFPAIQGGEAQQFLKITSGEDGYEHSSVGPDTSIQTQDVIDLATYTLTPSDNGKALLISNDTAECTIEIPDNLGSGFNCTFLNQSAAQYVNFANIGGGTINLNSKLGLTLDKSFASASLFVEDSADCYLVGALLTVV